MRYLVGLILYVLGHYPVGVSAQTTISASPQKGNTTCATASTPDDLQVLLEKIQGLKEGQQAIQQQLRDIHKILSAQGQPNKNVQEVDFIVNVANDPFQGSQTATATLIEFTDYQCPYCALHSQDVLPKLTKHFIDTGKIRYVLRDFPLISIHKDAKKAHEAAHCAGEQGKYWEMHHQLFTHQKELKASQLAGYARAANIADSLAFQACLDSGIYEDQTKESMTEGIKRGVLGTPSFILGHTQANGTVRATSLIHGAQDYLVFQELINELLASPKPRTIP